MRRWRSKAPMRGLRTRKMRFRRPAPQFSTARYNTDERNDCSVANLRRNRFLRRRVDEVLEIRLRADLATEKSLENTVHRQRAYGLRDEFTGVASRKMDHQHGTVIEFSAVSGAQSFG